MEPEEYSSMAQVEASHWWYKGLRERVFVELDDHVGEGTTVLDAGCGTGGTMAALRSRFPLAKITGIDLSPLAVPHAKDKAAGDVAHGTVNALPFADGVFDVVLVLDVLYHSGVDDNEALQELLRVLKSNGIVLINVPAFEWIRSDHDKVVHTARRYTAGQLRAKATQVGFEIVDCGYRNSLLFPLMVVQRLAERVTRHKAPKSAVVRLSAPVNFLLGAVLGFENRLLKSGVRFPAGGSVFEVLTKHAG